MTDRIAPDSRVNTSEKEEFTPEKAILELLQKVPWDATSSEGTALDLGAGDGRVTIWLAQQFPRVMAVEADPRWEPYLCENVYCSGRTNITFSNRPITLLKRTTKVPDVPSTPGVSNTSSTPEIASIVDTERRSTTFLQFLADHDLLDSLRLINLNLPNDHEILETVLHYSYYHQVPLCWHFDLERWTSGNSKWSWDFASGCFVPEALTKLRNVWSFFRTSSAKTRVNPLNYICTQKTGGLLLVPEKINPRWLFPRSKLACVIISYNQYTYLRDMVRQLESYPLEILIIDNCSTFQPLLDYYQDTPHTVIRRSTNEGHRVWMSPDVQLLTGQRFLLTDPDLRFHPKLPSNWITQLIAVADRHFCWKVGFALDISSPLIRDDIYYHHPRTGYQPETIVQWEAQHWQQPVVDDLPLYKAGIDTTLCLVTLNYPQQCIRIGGHYTAEHRPWYKGWERDFLPGELASMRKDNVSSTWSR